MGIEFASSGFLTAAPPKRRLRIHSHRFAPRVFFSYIDGLCKSHVRSFLASTHARFYKELDRETGKVGNGDFKKTFRYRLPWFTEI